MPEKMPDIGSIHTLTPHDLSLSGGSVAKLAGITVFLDKGLPEEILEARITAHAPRFMRAEVVRRIQPSPHETPSFCSYGGVCGGCAFPTLAYGKELAWKERQVKETLCRIGHVSFDGESEFLPIIPSPAPLAYRNKVEFAFGFAENLPALGLRQKNSREIVSIADCPLCAMPLASILSAVRAWLRDSSLSPWDGQNGYLRFLVVRCPTLMDDGAPQCLVECITAPGGADMAQKITELGELLMQTTPITGFVHSLRRAKENVAYGEKTVTSLGKTVIAEQFGHVLLHAPVQAFLQINTGAASLLYEQLARYADREHTATIWDIYSGVGSMALYLAKEGRAIRGMESTTEAVNFANKNVASLPQNRGDVAFIRYDANKALNKLTPTPDLVITDPPRGGLAKETIKTLRAINPARIIAIGCDTANLARDLALFQPAYQVRSARAVDMFPHTPHVETIALLARQ